MAPTAAVARNREAIGTGWTEDGRTRKHTGSLTPTTLAITEAGTPRTGRDSIEDTSWVIVNTVGTARGRRLNTMIGRCLGWPSQSELPQLIVSAPIIPLLYHRSIVGRDARDIQGLPAMLGQDLIVAVANRRNQPLLIVSAPIIPLLDHGSIEE